MVTPGRMPQSSHGSNRRGGSRRGGYISAWAIGNISGRIFENSGAGRRRSTASSASPCAIGVRPAPDVAALSDGGWVVTWQDNDGLNDNDVLASIYNAEIPSFRAGFINVNGGTDNDILPTVAPITGGFAIIYNEVVGANDQVRFQRYNLAGAPQGTEVLADSTGTANRELDATGLANGGFAFVYTDNGQSAGAETDISLQVWTSAGDFTSLATANVNIPGFNAGLDGNQTEPTIDVMSNGFLTVSWTNAGGTVDRAVWDPNNTVGPFTAFIANPAGVRLSTEDQSAIAGLPFGRIALLGRDTSALDVTGLLEDLVRTTTGDGTSEILIGDSLRDNMFGLGGNDILNGGTNADTMAGGLGDDSYFVDNAGDQITEAAGEGIDNVISSLFAFTLSANFENIQLIGAAVAGTGNGSDNVLTGNALNNSLVGLGGNDVMLGGPGADTMFGGLGDDSYYVDDPGDVAGEVAGEGVDTIHSSLPLFTLAEPFEVLFLEPGATSGVGNGGDNTLVGNAVANFLIGNDGNDTIFGEAGADVMVGGRGVDVYYVDVAGDLVIENPNEGADVLVSAAPVYTLPDNVETLFLTGPAVTAIGNNGDNTLAGTAAVNFLLGGGGNDTFNGGGEADFLVGGAGIDVFLFTRTQANGDTVTDFTPGTDHIGFIGYGAGSFTQLNATQWQVVSQDGLTAETINFSNGARSPSRGLPVHLRVGYRTRVTSPGAPTGSHIKPPLLAGLPCRHASQLFSTTQLPPAARRRSQSAFAAWRVWAGMRTR